MNAHSWNTLLIYPAYEFGASAKNSTFLCELACSVVQVCGLIFLLKEIDRARVMASESKGNCLSFSEEILVNRSSGAGFP